MEDIKVINEIKNNKKEIMFLIIYLLSGSLYMLFNKPGDRVYSLMTELDSMIPFTREFIIFYCSWYLFLPIVIIGLYLKEREGYLKLLMGFSLGMMCCYLIYALFQTTVPRPEILGNDIYSNLTRRIYANDNPFNCFPSIHVFTTAYSCFVIKEGYFRDKLLFRHSLNILGILIILSTLFVKQHVVLDGVGGAALAFLMYRLMYKPEGEKLLQWIKKKYSSLMMKKKLEI